MPIDRSDIVALAVGVCFGALLSTLPFIMRGSDLILEVVLRPILFLLYIPAALLSFGAILTIGGLCGALSASCVGEEIFTVVFWFVFFVHPFFYGLVTVVLWRSIRTRCAMRRRSG